MRRIFLLLCLAAVFAVPVFLPAQPAPSRAFSEHDREIASAFAETFPAAHLSREPLGNMISRRAWTNYLNALDYERVFFTQADIDRFRTEETLLGDQLKNGDLHFAGNVFEVYLQRVSNRCDYVDGLLKQGFDVTVKENYTWKRKDMPWPADETEWNDLWRRKIKNDYVQRLVVKALAATAATNPPTGSESEKETEEFRNRDAALTPEAFIRKRYQQLRTVLVDGDSEWIVQRYLTSFAQAYDPHSGYMSPSTAEDFDIEMKLSLVGIGALLRAEDGAAQIERLIPGGPADQDKREKRLRPGDRIVAVAQDKEEPVDVLHWPLYKVVKLIRGPKGTRVLLTVVPGSDPSGMTTKIVDLIRDEVKLEEQAARGRLESAKGSDGVARNLAVVTLPAFYANMKAASARDSDYRSASDDVRKILEDMKGRGAQGVLLDLRNDGGGSLLEAIRMTGLFIRTGPVVQVREGFSIRVLRDNDPDTAYAGPLVVLVDRRSASASEIVAGALQDYGRALILGDTKTHGKGTVQSVMDVGRAPSIGSMKVTTASYFRINGGSTQLRGIAADIVIPSPFDCMEVGEEFLPNPMAWSRVLPAPFVPVGSPAAAVSELTQKSLARRCGDARFAAYDKLLQRVKELSRTRELSLNLAERQHNAAMEKELSDLEDRLDTENAAPENAKDKVDLILEESLKVLADWTAMQEDRPATPPPAEERGMRNLSEAVSEWIRKVF